MRDGKISQLRTPLLDPKEIVQPFGKLPDCHIAMVVRPGTWFRVDQEIWGAETRRAQQTNRRSTVQVFFHQNSSIHNAATPKCSHGQILTCTLTTLWNNNVTSADRDVLKANVEIHSRYTCWAEWFQCVFFFEKKSTPDHDRIWGELCLRCLC